VERAVEVHPDHPIPVLVGQARQRRGGHHLADPALHAERHVGHGHLEAGQVEGAGDAGVVDHDVEPAVTRHHVVDGGVERGGISDVEHGRLAVDLLGHDVGHRLVEIVHHDTGAVGGEAPGEGGAEAGTGTRDDGNSSC
jgi:hypothetical protein